MQISRLNGIYNTVSRGKNIIAQPISNRNLYASKKKQVFTASKGHYNSILYNRVKVQNKISFTGFKQAKNIDEAKTFAYEHLGINLCYELEDLEVANYVNRALYEFQNRNKGMDPVFEGILTTDNEALMAGIHPKYPILFINEKVLKNLDETIKEALFDSLNEKDLLLYGNNALEFSLSKEQQRLIRDFQRDSKSMPLEDKINLAEFLRNVKTMSCLPSFISFINLYCNGGKENLEKFNIDIGFRTFSKLAQDVQDKIIQILNRQGIRLKVGDGGPFCIINHEIGHKLHRNQIGEEKFNNLNFVFKKSKVKETSNFVVLAMQNFIDKEPDWFHTVLVSPYASSSPGEFVAETYSYLAKGETLSDEIMELYRKYEGPENFN